MPCVISPHDVYDTPMQHLLHALLHPLSGEPLFCSTLLVNKFSCNSFSSEHLFCLTAALAIVFNCDDAVNHDDAVSCDVVSSRGDAHLVRLQAGHLTKKNKKCPMYVEPEPEVLEPWIPDVMLTHPTPQVGIITLPSPIIVHQIQVTHKPTLHSHVPIGLYMWVNQASCSRIKNKLCPLCPMAPRTCL